MGKYDQDSKELLNHIGGKENIQAVTHCITRMRFVLADPSKADIEAIEAMKVVKGSFTQSGQFQVIIGNNVADFYQDFVKVAGVEGVSKDAVKEAAKSNQTLIQRMVSVLAEVHAPAADAPQEHLTDLREIVVFRNPKNGRERDMIFSALNDRVAAYLKSRNLTSANIQSDLYYIASNDMYTVLVIGLPYEEVSADLQSVEKSG